VSVHKQAQKLALNIECHKFYNLHSREPAVLLYDTCQPPIACSRAGRAGQLIVSCFLHSNPSHIVVVGHVWDIYMFFNFNLNIYMVYNGIVTSICPLIQNGQSISIESYYILSHIFLDWNVKRDTQPCCKMWHTANSQTPIIMYFHTVYLVLAVSIPTSLPTYSRSIESYGHPRSLNPLFLLRILSLTLRLQLGQCPVRDGWVHWVSGALDNTQLLWESRKIIRCVVLFECRHWLLFVYEIEKTLDKREISHKAFICSLIQFSTFICHWRI